MQLPNPIYTKRYRSLRALCLVETGNCGTCYVDDAFTDPFIYRPIDISRLHEPTGLAIEMSDDKFVGGDGEFTEPHTYGTIEISQSLCFFEMGGV